MNEKESFSEFLQTHPERRESKKDFLVLDCFEMKNKERKSMMNYKLRLKRLPVRKIYENVKKILFSMTNQSQDSKQDEKIKEEVFDLGEENKYEEILK